MGDKTLKGPWVYCCISAFFVCPPLCYFRKKITKHFRPHNAFDVTYSLTPEYPKWLCLREILTLIFIGCLFKIHLPFSVCLCVTFMQPELFLLFIFHHTSVQNLFPFPRAWAELFCLIASEPPSDSWVEMCFRTAQIKGFCFQVVTRRGLEIMPPSKPQWWHADSSQSNQTRNWHEYTKWSLLKPPQDALGPVYVKLIWIKTLVRNPAWAASCLMWQPFSTAFLKDFLCEEEAKYPQMGS